MQLHAVTATPGRPDNTPENIGIYLASCGQLLAPAIYDHIKADTETYKQIYRRRHQLPGPSVHSGVLMLPAANTGVIGWIQRLDRVTSHAALSASHPSRLLGFRTDTSRLISLHTYNQTS